MILAGVLLKMGGYGIIRICYPICPAAGYDLSYWSAALACSAWFMALSPPWHRKISNDWSPIARSATWATSCWASACGALAGTEFNPDYWEMGMNGAMFQMIAHGISSAGMFFMVGVIYDRVHHRNLDEFGGLFAKMPLYTGLAIGIFFAGLGLPGLCGFIGEVLCPLRLEFQQALAVISASVVILTAGYILWAFQRVYLGPSTRAPTPKAYPDDARSGDRRAAAGFRDLFGVYPNALLKYMQPSVDKTVVELTDWTKKYGPAPAAKPATADAIQPENHSS